MKKKEAQKHHPEDAKKVKNYLTHAQGGEPYSEFKTRVTDTINELTQKPHRVIGIVTHGGPIKTFFREVLRKAIGDIQDCGFVEIEFDGTDYQLTEMSGINFEK